jgi:RecA-family ATPase
MTSGRPLLGSCPAQQLRVWIWNLEDPREELARRIQATAKHHELRASDLGDRLFVDSGREQALTIATTTRDGPMIITPVVESIILEPIVREIDVLVIDPFVSCHHVSENDNDAMDLIAKQWCTVAERANCAIELVHHTR